MMLLGDDVLDLISEKWLGILRNVAILASISGSLPDALASRPIHLRPHYSGRGGPWPAGQRSARRHLPSTHIACVPSPSACLPCSSPQVRRVSSVSPHQREVRQSWPRLLLSGNRQSDREADPTSEHR